MGAALWQAPVPPLWLAGEGEPLSPLNAKSFAKPYAAEGWSTDIVLGAELCSPPPAAPCAEHLL